MTSPCESCNNKKEKGNGLGTMKENEKQAIEEMARIIGAAIEFDELDFGMDEKTEIIAEKAAKAFYKEGYRKQIKGEWIFN